ncbi:MAG: extracellular solute-binding protein [Proteobacteria bacterium]|nr:extracellular solute-binding protein [Pseudomonadota bacterium]
MALIGLAPGLAGAGELVNVLYAGSLVNLMERSVGPAFDRASGDRFRGYAGGSKLLANQIKGRLRQADVFISAAPAVNARLMGAANGDWEAWYVTFAESALVIGYAPQSRFAADFKRRPWYRVVQSPGIRLGRTDPKLDPKGALTITLMQRAQAYYRLSGLAQRVLGSPENPAQVLPEEVLLGRLQSGELDAGFFYSTETSEARIPAVRLPPAITPKALYTIAVVRGSPHPEGADAFVAFLLGPQGRRLMIEHGLTIRPPSLTGSAASVPSGIRSLLAR